MARLWDQLQKQEKKAGHEGKRAHVSSKGGIGKPSGSEVPGSRGGGGRRAERSSTPASGSSDGGPSGSGNGGGAAVARGGDSDLRPQSFSLGEVDRVFLKDEMHRRRLGSVSEALRAILAEARALLEEALK